MLFPAKTALFDMDGTLLDTMAYWRLTYVEFLEERNLPIPESFQHVSAEKLFLKLAIDRILAAYPELSMDEPQVRAELLRLITRHYATDAVCKPGAIDYLKALRAQGVRIGLVTATLEEMADVALKRLGLYDLFDFRYYGGTGRKSDPAYFERILKEQACDAADCVMFEDALYAMQGAKAAGLRVYAIEDRFALPDRENIMALADCYAKDFIELMNQEENER